MNNPNSNKQGAPGQGKKNNNRRRHYNKNKSKNPNAQANGNGNNPGSSNSSKKRPFNNRRKQNPVKLSGLDFVTTKYLNLLEQHLQARRKYFENFDKVQGPALEKLEYNFIESQKVFLAFKERLSPEDLEAFEKHFNSYKPDFTYSSNHNIDPLETTIEVADEQIQDPHLLESQKRAFQDYSDDTEESMGSIDDYKKYKGITE
ncbi:hypothetical protein [Bacteriovorax sp. Seq25_V]|uniref:hypothetical protein n=1 Tax=Bacteriovorax sp. Seq25_V TaxID=1201288 RepID=UPI00038A476D|nr:hypothetical protein [Bacteriovorax sp. Seq25_V]EQC44897.1 hypothetical protein M900_A0120 [Bacteriovorax sp. Seq25_V]